MALLSFTIFLLRRIWIKQGGLHLWYSIQWLSTDHSWSVCVAQKASKKVAEKQSNKYRVS